MKRLALGTALACIVLPSCVTGAIFTSLSPGAATLGANDDGSSSSTAIGFTISYFGTSYSNLYANNNGNVTFGTSLNHFTPFGLSGATAIPIISPFFADVDTRGNGSGPMTYGATTLTTNDGVVRNAFVANWIGVGYFPSRANLLNSFQLVLVERADSGPGNFDIIFNYDAITWETGGGSGGVNGLGGNSARAGYSRGTGVAGTYYELAGSGVNGAFLDGGPAGTSLVNNTNVSLSDALYTRTNGRYVFNFRDGVVVDSDIPEPGTYVLAGTALVGLALIRRKRPAK